MAARYGWEWRVTNLDLGLAALQLGADRRSVVGSVCALPFADEAFQSAFAPYGLLQSLESDADLDAVTAYLETLR